MKLWKYIKKQKKYIHLIPFLCMILLSGCWDYNEFESTTIVKGIALDKGTNNTTKVSIQVLANFSADAENTTIPTNDITEIMSIERQNIQEALTTLVSHTGKNFFWGQSEILIIGNDLAKEGIMPIIDMFSRNTEFRRTQYVIVAKGEASTLLAASTNLDPISTQNIYSIEENINALAITRSIPFYQLMIELVNNKKQSTMSFFHLFKGTNPAIAGSAVFKDDKMIGSLNILETEGMNYINNQVKGGIIIGDFPNQPDKTISFDTLFSKTKRSVSFQQDQPVIDLNVSLIVNITDFQDYIDLKKKENIQKVKKALEDQIKLQMESVLEKAQKEFNSDIFGFADSIYHKDHQKWDKVSNNWDEIFPMLEVNISVESKIKEAGLLTNPIPVSFE